MGFLKHHAEGTAQVLAVNLANVDVVVEDASVLNVVETIDEVGDGGLSCSRSSHEGYLLSCIGVELYIEKHLFLWNV